MNRSRRSAKTKKRLPRVSNRRGKVTLIAFAVLVVAFGWGVLQLLIMRFETGDMFPPYSSYRNDPLGTKALFASLDRLTGISSLRYVDTLEKRSSGPADQTFLLIGVNTEQPNEAPQSVVEELDEVLEKGGRVVMAFNPSIPDFQEEELRRSGMPVIGRGRDDDEEEESDRPSALGEPMISLEEHWGIELKHEPLRFDGDGGIIVQDATLHADDGLPKTLEWHNGLQFNVDEEVWRTMYECRDEVVVAERVVGSGTLVFVGDAYYLTNEGLAVNRQPEFIAWVIGGNPHVQFDEVHLGMQRNPGAAALMRRYNLEGMIAGFVFLAILFAWRAASSLAPRYSDTLPSDGRDMELGRDAHAGFANLVKRSTSRADVVGACVEQWRQSVLPGLGRTDAKEIGEALTEAVQANTTTAPLDAYRAVLNQLRERNVHTAYDRKS